MPADQKNVFISHIHEDDDGLKKLKYLVGKNGMKFHDYSINADNPNSTHDENYIKYQILAPRIDQCSVLVVYISPETKDIKYVNWEIEYAEKAARQLWVFGLTEKAVANCQRH